MRGRLTTGLTASPPAREGQAVARAGLHQDVPAGLTPGFRGDSVAGCELQAAERYEHDQGGQSRPPGHPAMSDPGTEQEGHRGDRHEQVAGQKQRLKDQRVHKGEQGRDDDPGHGHHSI